MKQPQGEDLAKALRLEFYGNNDSRSSDPDEIHLMQLYHTRLLEEAGRALPSDNELTNILWSVKLGNIEVESAVKLIKRGNN